MSAILKRKRIKKPRKAYKVMPDGREVICNNPAGTALWRARREWVFMRDGGICQIPGCKDHDPIPFFAGTVDHIIPKGMGGSTRDDRESNLRWAHWECNSRKGSQRDVQIS